MSQTYEDRVTVQVMIQVTDGAGKVRRESFGINKMPGLGFVEGLIDMTAGLLQKLFPDYPLIKMEELPGEVFPAEELAAEMPLPGGVYIQPQDVMNAGLGMKAYGMAFDRALGATILVAEPADLVILKRAFQERWERFAKQYSEMKGQMR